VPFAPGEELVFGVRSSRFGRIGEAVMRVEGPEAVRGREAYVLSFDFAAKVLLFRISDRTRSWFDPGTLSSLRYSKEERSPVSDRDELVEIYPDDGWWVDDGERGELATSTPLDELSFLYYVRMLPLLEGDVYRIERHFDARRNPVTIAVVGRQSLRESPAASAAEAVSAAAPLSTSKPASSSAAASSSEAVPPFAGPAASAAGSGIEPASPVGEEVGAAVKVVIVDMHVPDARQENGTTRIRLYLTDDPSRLPVRLETAMPFGGTMVLELKQCVRNARATQSP
jgi:hypothetical protein